MYYVPDGTTQCGYYECEDCETGFLDLRIAPRLVCPYCGEEVDMEVGPDDEMPVPREAAKLIKMLEGAEEVEKYDILLSLAITGGDYNWID
ncbi:MAG: FYDLN acid domain-containing protein [Clostridia bacterium]|nr:FYDLN acid domain-containing protein [Clostridia bacterium]